jgi:hypothetical protein
MEKTRDVVLRSTNIPLTYIKGLTFTGSARVTCAAAILHRFFFP